MLTIHAIDPARLDTVREAGEDGHGNAFVSYPATGEGEPLRCCLRHARPGEPIALISYAPFEQPSPWREVGPVYVHAERTPGTTTRSPGSRTSCGGGSECCGRTDPTAP